MRCIGATGAPAANCPGQGSGPVQKRSLPPRWTTRRPRTKKTTLMRGGLFWGVPVELGCAVGEVEQRGEHRGVAQDAGEQAGARAEFDGVGVERAGGDVVDDSCNFGHESLRMVDRRATGRCGGDDLYRRERARSVLDSSTRPRPRRCARPQLPFCTGQPPAIRQASTQTSKPQKWKNHLNARGGRWFFDLASSVSCQAASFAGRAPLVEMQCSAGRFASAASKSTQAGQIRRRLWIRAELSVTT